MGTTWGPRGCGEPHGDNMQTTWGQHEDNMGTTWGPQGSEGHMGDNMETTWGQDEDNVDNSILFEDL